MVNAVTLMEAINAARSVHRYFGDFVTLISGGEAMEVLPDFDEAKYEDDKDYKALVDAERAKTTWSGKVEIPSSASLVKALDLVAEAIAKQQHQVGYALKGFALPSVATLVPNFDGTLTVEVELVVEESSPTMKLTVNAVTGFEAKAASMGKVELKRTVPS